MKGDTEVVLMVVFFIAGMALVKLAENISTTPLLELVLGAGATLVAAFFGARYAYALNVASAEEKTLKEQVTVGNQAIFELVRTYNQFIAIRNQFIAPHRESPVRHVFILPMAGSIHALSLKFDELAFLFDSEDPNLLGRLAMFQQEVASTMDVITQRSRMHVEAVQTTIERLEKAHGERIELVTLERELGTRTAQSMRMLTDFMIEGVDGVISGGEKLIEELSRILRARFVGHTIVGMTKPTMR